MISFEGVSVARNFFHFRFMLKKFGKKLKTTDEKYSGDKPEYEPIIDHIFLVFKGVLSDVFLNLNANRSV